MSGRLRQRTGSIALPAMQAIQVRAGGRRRAAWRAAPEAPGADDGGILFVSTMPGLTSPLGGGTAVVGQREPALPAWCTDAVAGARASCP